MTQSETYRLLDGKVAASMLRAGLADTAVFRAKGTAANISCRVMIDRGVQLIGDQSQVINDQITLSCFLAEVPKPARGDTFTIGTEVLTVDSITHADESRVVCIVKAGC